MSQLNFRTISSALLAATLAFGQLAKADAVDINLANAESLAVNIVGVGPVLAEAIVAYRLENGSFASADQLLEVPGVGPKILENNGKTLLVDGEAYQN